MKEESAQLQSIVDSVARLRGEVEEARPGEPELAAVVASVINLQGRLKQVRSVLGPLVSDANREASVDEKTAISLERLLHSLRSAAEAKRFAG